MRPHQGRMKSWIIFVVVIVALFGLLSFWQRQKEPAAPPPEEISETPPGLRRPFAGETRSEEEIARQNQESLHQAWTTGSIQGCESIQDEALKQRCIDHIHFAAFSKGKDETLCEKLVNPELRQQCADQIYYRVAMEELNADFCEKIQEPARKQNCFDRIQSIVGSQATRLSDCEAIANATLKNQCIDNFHYTQSIENVNREGCEAIRENTLQERCRVTVEQNERVIQLSQAQTIRTALTPAELMEDCEQLGNENVATCKDATNFNLALEKQDLTYCNAIRDIQRRNECLQEQGAHLNRLYLKQAIAKQDESLCHKIIEASLKNACLTYLQQ